MWVLQGVSPAIRRLIAPSFTARWQDRSALRDWAKNIESVSVGGNSLSRCGGKDNSTASNNSGPVNRLKNACASTLPAFAAIVRHCRMFAVSVACIWADSSYDGRVFGDSNLSRVDSACFIHYISEL